MMMNLSPTLTNNNDNDDDRNAFASSDMESYVESPQFNAKYSSEPKKSMEKLGFFDYYTESQLLTAYEEWIEGTITDENAALKKLNGFCRVVTNQNPRVLRKTAPLSLNNFLHPDTIDRVFEIMEQHIPELSASTSIKYTNIVSKFVEFLEASDQWFPIFDIPLMTKQAKVDLAVVKRILIKWKKQFEHAEKDAKVWQNYGVAVRPDIHLFDLRLAQSVFESNEFRDTVAAIEAYVTCHEFGQHAGKPVNSVRQIQDYYEFLVLTLAAYCILNNNFPFRITFSIFRILDLEVSFRLKLV